MDSDNKKITQLTVGIPVGTDIMPYVSDPGGTPSNKAVLVSSLRNLSMSVTSVTTSNLTAVVNTSYHLDLSGLTATRNFILPAGAVGDIVEINVYAAHATYALVIIGDTGMSINTSGAATEWSRLILAGESLRLRAITTSRWQVISDGRIPCKSTMLITSSDTTTTNTAGTEKVVDWNSSPLDVGSIADPTNNRFNIRRAGYYAVAGGAAPYAGIGDGKYYIVRAYKNSTYITAGGCRQSTAGGAASSILGAQFPRQVFSAAVGDTVDMRFTAEETDKGVGRTDNTAPQLVGFTRFSIEEVLQGVP